MCAKLGNLNTRVYIDQYNLSGFLNSFDLGIKQELGVVTCFSDTGPKRVVGNYDHSFSNNGFFDGADDSYDEIIHALIGSTSTHYLCQMPGANAENNICYEQMVMLNGKPMTGAVGAGLVLNIAGDGSDGIARSLVLRNATISGTGAGTGRNMGATASGTTFQAVVRAISGTFSSITVRIQESQNDGGADPYADISGMTTTMTVPAVARLTTTAATEAWKTVNIQAFTGTSVVLLVTAGTLQGT